MVVCSVYKNYSFVLVGQQGRGAMTNFLITSYVAHLISLKKLNRVMSSYQIMRNTLIHLSKYCEIYCCDCLVLRQSV